MRAALTIAMALSCVRAAGAGGDGSPTVTIFNAMAAEGTALSFIVTATGWTPDTTVSWATEDLTATQGSDYVRAQGVLSLPPGAPPDIALTFTISITLLPDTPDNTPEGNEVLFVRLTAENANVINDLGHGVILDEPVVDDVRACNLAPAGRAPIWVRYLLPEFEHGTPVPAKHNPKHELDDVGGTLVSREESDSFQRSDWHLVVAGEFGGNGRCKLIWSRLPEKGVGDAPLELMITDAPDVPEAGTGRRIDPPGPGSYVVGSGDFNGDGATDVLWWEPSISKLVVWESGGPDSFPVRRVPVDHSLWSSPTMTPIAVARLTGDGTPKVIWRDVNGVPSLGPEDHTPPSRLGYSSIERFDPLQAFVAVPGAKVDQAADQVGCNVVAAADFDLDGSDDLLWQDPTSGSVVVTFLRGVALRGRAPLSPDRFELTTESGVLVIGNVIGPR